MWLQSVAGSVLAIEPAPVSLCLSPFFPPFSKELWGRGVCFPVSDTPA